MIQKRVFEISAKEEEEKKVEIFHSKNLGLRNLLFKTKTGKFWYDNEDKYVLYMQKYKNFKVTIFSVVPRDCIDQLPINLLLIKKYVERK